MLAVLVPGVGVSANGATRWIGAGPLTFQPAELAKLTLLVWVADLLARRAAVMHNTRATLRPVIVLLTITALIMAQPNLGTTVIVASIAIALCFVAGAPLARLAGWTTWRGGGDTAGHRRPLPPGAGAGLPRPVGRPHQHRLPEHPVARGLDGGVAGVGLGASRAKWGLPYAHSDFIFAIIGEELGWVGAAVVVGLFGLLGVIGIRIALHAPDRFGLLLAVGVTAWFLVQAFVNIGAVIGILPITGVPLPFVSSGGSSLVFSMAGAGLLLSVAARAGSTATRSQRSHRACRGPPRHRRRRVTMTAAETPGTGCYALIAAAPPATCSRPSPSPGARRPRAPGRLDRAGRQRAGSRPAWCPPPASPSRCCRASIERKLSVQNLRSLWGLVRALGQAGASWGASGPASSCRSGATPACPAPGGRRAAHPHRRGRAQPGAANRLVSRFAKACAISFPDTPLPRAVVTGNPVRPEVLAIDRPATPWAPAPSSTSSRAAAWSSSSRWAPCGSTGPPSRPPACGPAAPTCTCAT